MDRVGGRKKQFSLSDIIALNIFCKKLQCTFPLKTNVSSLLKWVIVSGIAYDTGVDI